MKTKWITIGLMLVAAVHLSCTPDEEMEWSMTFPRLGPATRGLESVERKLDPVAQRGEEVSVIVRDAAREADGIGVPGAGLVAVIASVLGTILGIYNERRRGTVPLTSALEQVVQSVEAAFPDRSEAQKSAMSAVQDRATRQIVSQVKGE